MQINIDYDSSVNSAPAGFQAGVQAAVQYLDSEFTNPITLTIDVGYGEIEGQSLGAGALGESEASQYVSEGYGALRNALLAEGAPGSATLPASSPLSGTLYMSQAEAKALGLPQNNDPIDGYVGFSSSPGIFSYANGTTPPSNEYYFIGVVEHEITEDMGRVSLLDDQPHDYAPLDLFRYSSPGVRDLRTGGSGSTAYFSIDSGNTNLGSWNNNPNNGDLADWYPSGPATGGDDAFNDQSSPGVVNAVSTDDITLMEALGWTRTPSGTVSIAVSGQKFSIAEGQATAITSDFTVSNPGGDNITEYLFEDFGGGGGYLSVAGTVEPDNQVITVPASELGAVEYVGGFSLGGDTLKVGIVDATTNSDVWSAPFTATIVYLTGSGNVDEWLLTNGQWAASAEPGSSPSGYEAAGIGDFTGGGSDGILWYNSSTGDVSEWKIANAAFAGSIDLGTHPGSYQISGVGDFNDSGADDVLWTSVAGNGQVQTDIWELANGQWAASVSPGIHPAGYQVAGVGDFTGNGTSDILWYDPATGDVDEWLIANGKWSVSIDLGSHPGSGWQIAGVGDFTGNSTDDVLWFNAGTGQTDIWELANGKWAASVSPGAHPLGYQVAAVGNFAGTGTDGVLWYDPSTGDVDQWQLSNGKWSVSINLGVHPGSYQIAGAGDFTGNGTKDILWHSG
jgi:hypothetical protein